MSEMARFEPRAPGAPAQAAPPDLQVRLARPGDAAEIAAISAAREGLEAREILPRITFNKGIGLLLSAQLPR